MPLSNHALNILRHVHERTGRYDLVFPNSRDYRRIMSENTLTYGIRHQLGFDATAHGFRTTASTILNEAGFRLDVIERQLAHAERNKVRGNYSVKIIQKKLDRFLCDFAPISLHFCNTIKLAL